MSRASEFYFVDIFVAADKVHRYTDRFETAQQFLYSELEWDATLRELEIIGEAANALLKQQSIDEKYRSIVNFRNHITHAYFGIDEEIVWEVVTTLLQAFVSELILLIQKENLDLSDAIASAKKDYAYSDEICRFLDRLTVKLMMEK